MSTIIKVEDLVKDFGDLRAVDGISFEVEEGEIFGFLGPNGAGKSTTIKMMTALLRPTEGNIWIDGVDVCSNPKAIRSKIGLVFQSSSLDDRLTGWENLKFHGILYNMESGLIERRVEELSTNVGLSERLDDPVKNYSGGMKRRLELIRGLLHHPHVLFLDEPTIGLDPQTRRHIWEYIIGLEENEEVSIFLTTHYMDEVEIAKHAAIIDEGTIIALDEVEALKKDLGGDIIVLSTTDNENSKVEIREKFNLDVEQVDSKLKIAVNHGDEFIPNLLSSLSDKVTSINLREPTMDDVFLDLTGKEIRDSGPEKTPVMKRGH
ncbi:MAG: ATP-binding cassette domain-containing protein [Candidatus Bipolaricaulota bacterium]